MRTERELHLHQQLVLLEISGVLCEPVLPANLTEFAWPIGEHGGHSVIFLKHVARAFGPVISAADKPATAKLIVSRSIHAEGTLQARQNHGRQLLALAPDQLRPSNKRVVDGAPQRLPAH